MNAAAKIKQIADDLYLERVARHQFWDGESAGRPAPHRASPWVSGNFNGFLAADADLADLYDAPSDLGPRYPAVARNGHAHAGWPEGAGLGAWPAANLGDVVSGAGDAHPTGSGLEVGGGALALAGGVTALLWELLKRHKWAVLLWVAALVLCLPIVIWG